MKTTRAIPRVALVLVVLVLLVLGGLVFLGHGGFEEP
jgi:hypothetical protein